MSILDVINNSLNGYTSSSTGGSNASAVASPTPTTSNTTSTTDSSHGPAYLIDISEAAQKILDEDRKSGVANQFGGKITLTDAQKQKIEDILSKYENDPLTDDVIALIDKDLQAAGVAPDQLAKIQELKEYSPVNSFLQLVGSDGSSSSPASLIGSGDSNESSLIPTINNLIKLSGNY